MTALNAIEVSLFPSKNNWKKTQILNTWLWIFQPKLLCLHDFPCVRDPWKSLLFIMTHSVWCILLQVYVLASIKSYIWNNIKSYKFEINEPFIIFVCVGVMYPGGWCLCRWKICLTARIEPTQPLERQLYSWFAINLSGYGGQMTATHAGWIRQWN